MSGFIKICGLANAADVEAVAALEPDALGFIFYPKSPRAARPEDVAEWTRDLPDSITTVGVTVNLSPSENQRVRAAAGVDVLQLHGQETAPADAQRTWKAVHLNQDVNLDLDPFDVVLIDSYTSELPGGTGIQLDWQLARDFVVQQARRNVLLAGGLKADGVSAAISAVQPWGVDVSSGVELRPGQKDISAVRDFISAARASFCK